jgi:hypothetical protein
MIEVERTMLHIFATLNGRAEIEGLGMIEGEDAGWALKYCSVFCANCYGPLDWSATNSELLNKLEWWEHDCEHALRFCSSCVHAQCWMCEAQDASYTLTHRRVWQAISDSPMHQDCMIDPCGCCKAV